MTTIVTRAGKGSALTWTEGDANITNLNNDKIELTDLSVSTGSASGGGTLSYNNTTGAFSFAPADLSSYLTSYTETDPVVGAITGIVKADGAGNISAATAGTDYLADITSESVGSLSDVDLTGITDGQVLVWDNANSKFIAGDAGGGGAIDDLSDVTITTPSNGQVLTYMASGQWENQDLPGGASTLDELTDVDTTSVANGDLLVYDSANSKFIASSQYGASEVTGNVIDIDDVRDPNTLTLDSYATIQAGDEIIFSGTDCSAVGITAGNTYYVWADAGDGAFEISADNSNPMSLTDIGTISDLTYSVTTQPTGFTLGMISDVQISAVSDGSVLKWSSTSNAWQASLNITGITSVSEDTNPSLGGNLQGGGYTVSDIELYDYKETIYSLGSTDSPSIDVANGNVQTVTISSGLSLPAFTNAETGQSVTLIVTGSGTATGATGYKFAGGETTLTSYSIVSIFYDGTTYWTSINTDFQ